MRESQPEQANEEEPELAGFLAEVSAECEQLATQAHPLPDFGEVLRRARTLDPSAVSDEMLDEAAKLAPVVPIAGLRSVPEEAADEGLRGFLDEVRSHNEGLVDERRLAGIPPLVRPARAGKRRWALALVGVAAALALALLGPELMTPSSRGATPTSSAAMMQGIVERVEHVVALEVTDGRALVDGGRGAPAAQRELVRQGTADADEDGSSALLVQPEGEAEGEAEAAEAKGEEPSEPRARRAAPSAEALDAELRALDEEAQAAWRLGDLKGAEKGFRRIIRRAPRGRWAQLAYGDLFNLVRQGGDPEAELALWREYLRRYPKGPHADDAHAGTCRRSATSDRGQCWRAYLEVRPRGAYRQQAEAALSPEEAGGG